MFRKIVPLKEHQAYKSLDELSAGRDVAAETPRGGVEKGAAVVKLWSSAGIFLVLICFFQGKITLAEELRDIRPPVDIPFNWKPVFLALSLVLLAAFLFFVKKLIRFRKERPLRPEIKKSPFEIAYEALEELKLKHLPENDKVKQYYSELSDITRHFIEDYYGIKAAEMTTPEFLDFVKKNYALSPSHKDLLREFLNSCDMVKFAKYGPNIKEIEESFVLAKKFIDEVKTADDEKKKALEIEQARK
ncbi:MAG: hypothetical protein HQL27_05625 [Candidatus Omnitrophica bacterium]|nr:hypothetical protein [Candidatus Omnitrophota bacterium]